MAPLTNSAGFTTSKPVRLAVTGANGFVGQALCRQLMAHGHSVVAIVRSSQALASLPRGVTRRRCQDLADAGRVAGLFEGVDVVVHLVGRTHCGSNSNDYDLEFERVNVAMTRMMLDEAIRCRVRRFVYLSSIKAVGEGGREVYDESTECQPLDAYGRTKRAAEQLVLDSADGGLIESVILRPPLVYGPGARGNLLALMQAIDRGRPLPLGRLRSERSLIGLTNLTDAILRAAVQPQAAGGLFHVADQQPVLVADLARLLGDYLQRPARLWPVPATCLRLAGAIVGKSEQVQRLVQSLVVNSQLIRTRLNWCETLSFAEEVEQMVATYRQLHPRDVSSPLRQTPNPNRSAQRRAA